MSKFIMVMLVSLFSSVVLANNICTKDGGQIINKKTPSGHKYQVCAFEDNRQCAIMALKNKICPIGGLKITGYDNEAQMYCVINGGKTIAESNAICTLPNGKKISVDKYYN
ncbi:MAG: DUF333 domain-containing protein [Burkholderiales bacterium]|nr:DUF333 domain-containing protein [Burkholderiales bacterium]